MFKEVLREVVERTEGGIASLLMGYDGIPVENYVKSGVSARRREHRHGVQRHPHANQQGREHAGGGRRARGLDPGREHDHR